MKPFMAFAAISISLTLRERASNPGFEWMARPDLHVPNGRASQKAASNRYLDRL